jgi:hypothetical protein
VSHQISPELVLVDPELARLERARPIEQPPPVRAPDLVGRDPEPVPRQPLPRHMPPPGSRARAARSRSVTRFALVALLIISLMASGVLVALKLPRERGERRILVLPEAVSKTPHDHARAASNSTITSRQPGSSTGPRTQNATTKPQRPPSPVTPRAAATPNKHRTATTRKRGNEAVARLKLPIETRAIVERKVLALVVQSPVGKLPPTLIDRQTGLAKNNLQAVCKRTSNSRSFRCVVESAVKPPSGRVYVSYRPTRNGRGRFTWSPDRSG